jgi:GNAT superfamily N-acetyltransferase
MDYRVMATEEILRIGEVNREESVEAEYVAKRDGSGFRIAVSRVENTRPEEVPPWGEVGTRRRIEKWKPSLERGGQFYGAFDGDRLVGFVILGPRRGDASAEIVALFVDRDHRRGGVGRTLMDWACATARDMEVTALFLYSNPTESAVEFYLRSGFQIVGLTSKEIVASVPEDILMARRLSAD